MKILSVDTSTPTCTVGVVDGDGLLAESVDSSGQTHARHLMGMIDSSMAASGISIQEIDGFAVVTGPGTFTGLRIGISTIKGSGLRTIQTRCRCYQSGSPGRAGRTAHRARLPGHGRP